MVHYGEAIKRPFTNFLFLIVGIALSLLPVLNFFAKGYFLACARTAKKKKFTLPEWKAIWELFVDGFFFFIIKLAYSIPLIIVTLIVLGDFLVEAAFLLFAGASPEELAVLFPELGIGIIICLVVALLTAYITPAALTQFGISRNAKDAFSQKVFSFAFSERYVLPWIVGILLSVLATLVFTGIPYIGHAVSAFVGGVILFTVLGEAHA